MIALIGKTASGKDSIKKELLKLGYESDTYQKFLIKRDIKKLKYQMNKYYVSSIFSIGNSEMKFEQKSKDGLLMRVRKVGLKR